MEKGLHSIGSYCWFYMDDDNPHRFTVSCLVLGPWQSSVAFFAGKLPLDLFYISCKSLKALMFSVKIAAVNKRLWLLSEVNENGAGVRPINDLSGATSWVC